MSEVHGDEERKCNMTPQEKREYLLDLLRAANEIARHQVSGEFQVIKNFKTGHLQIQLYSEMEHWANEVYDLRISKKRGPFGNPLLMIRNAEKRHPDHADRPWPYWVYFHESNLQSPDEDAVYLGSGEALLRLTWTPTN